jgi:hypothetical protein
MNKIYDYLAFNDSKNPSNTGDYTFGMEVKYVDIDIHNKPEEYTDINDAKAFIQYTVNFIIKKAGIDSIDFVINSIEFEFEVDDSPNAPKEFDMDLVPGKTIDFGQIQIEKGDSCIPTYPTKLEIDMNKSTEPSNFDVIVHFNK